MRICNCPVPLAKHAEAMYASLDQEALAVTLFHKLAVAALQDGILESAVLAQRWLLFLLNCIYLSAEDYQEKLDELNEKGIDIIGDKNHGLSGNMFYPNERLLNRDGGDLSRHDVLLAQGHERMCSVPLMMYLLLQCDALRKYSYDRFKNNDTSDGRGNNNTTSINFRNGINTDLRTCAMMQMISMTPNQLVRCIAPRIQIWETGKNITEPFIDVIELKMEAIHAGVLEYCNSGMISRTTGNTADLILLVDAPDHIVLLDGRYINVVYDNTKTNLIKETAHKDHSALQRKPLVLGLGLEEAIKEASMSYRTRPIIVYDIDQSSSNGRGTMKILKDFLIEDTKCLSLAIMSEGCNNFDKWKRYIAQKVQR